MHFRGHELKDSDNNNVKLIYPCCAGTVVPLEKLSNDAFSSLVLGDGFGLFPDTAELTAPADASVRDVSSDKKNLTLKTEDGLIMIISVDAGSDDNSFNSECLVKPGQNLKLGEPIFRLDSPDPHSAAVALVITNSETLPSFNIIYGDVAEASQPVMIIRMK